MKNIALNEDNLSDVVGRPREAYVGTGFSKLQRHGVWYKSFPATKSLMLKLIMIYMEFETDHIEEIFKHFFNPFYPQVVLE